MATGPESMISVEFSRLVLFSLKINSYSDQLGE